ncbi:MAG: FAD-dependent oxidoreductase [Cyclobacteriaceae bacterium]
MVGQGLAGSCLALRLLAQGKRVIVFDEPHQNRSSAIAAGLFNPITGKLMTRTWMAEKIFPELHQFYQNAEQQLGQKFFYPQPLYRPFISVEEQNSWMGKSSDPSMSRYIEAVFSTSTFGHQVHDPFGGILLKHCGYLDVLQFMLSVRHHLTATQSIALERFDEQLLEIGNYGVKYNDMEADKIILCNGMGILRSSRFTGVPVRLLKGETLTVKIDQVPELIYNRGVYIVPRVEKNFYRVGATYETKNLSEETTTAGRMELDEKLTDLIKLPYKVISQDWGFRPTSPDRRPILGHLPDSKNVVIFNGLGTKGVSLAPYFSAQLSNWLLGFGEIQPEVNIGRFKSLSSKSSEVV